jgi:hypothetical protein
MRKERDQIKRRARVVPDVGTVDPSLEAASPRPNLSLTGATSTNSSHYEKSDQDQLAVPFKKHKRSNKKTVSPYLKKTTAYAYQVSWNFQALHQRSIFAAPGDISVTGTPDGPPIHRPFFKSQYLDALGRAVSAATTTGHESVNKSMNSFASLPLKHREGLANESLLLASPVLPRGAGQRLFVGLDTGGLHHRFLQRERLLHPEKDSSLSNTVKLQSRYHGDSYFRYSAWWLQCTNLQNLPKRANGVAIAIVSNYLGIRAVELGAVVEHTSYHMIYVL